MCYTHIPPAQWLSASCRGTIAEEKHASVSCLLVFPQRQFWDHYGKKECWTRRVFVLTQQGFPNVNLPLLYINIFLLCISYPCAYLSSPASLTDLLLLASLYTEQIQHVPTVLPNESIQYNMLISSRTYCKSHMAKSSNWQIGSTTFFCQTFPAYVPMVLLHTKSDHWSTYL